MTRVVQTIDFSKYLGSQNMNSKKETAQDILASFKSIGFVCLTSHGVPQSEIDAMFVWSKRFFDLPMEKKMMAPHPESGAHHRGYSAPGREFVARDEIDDGKFEALRDKKDCKESFEAGREYDHSMPNIWLPEEVLPGFKEACLKFYWTCYELEKTIMRALAVALDLDEEYFIPFHSNADNQLRLLHYPTVHTDTIDEEVSRISAHTDFTTITLLFQDRVGGLEVEHPNEPGVFLPVVPVPNSVIVNAGDFLARWSNDIIKSTLHRVRAPPGVSGLVPERYSIPYFCACNLDMVVDAIPGTWNEENPKKYRPASVKEYIMERLAAAY